MLRRRFMLNSYRWLWRKITESVILKSIITKAFTILVKINDKSGKVDKNVALTAKDVSDLKINRSLAVSRVVTPRSRLRADPVFIRDVTIYKFYKAITAPAKLCKFVRNQTVKYVSKLMMCLTYLTSYKVHIIPILTANGITADTIKSKINKSMYIKLVSSIIKADTIKTNSDEKIIAIKNVSVLGAYAPDISIAKISTDINYAKLICWSNAVLENGVLTIHQVYEGILNDDILEIDPLIDSIFENGVLTIIRPYSVAQTNDILAVDLWIDSILENNTLNIEYAYNAKQTEKLLEVD